MCDKCGHPHGIPILCGEPLTLCQDCITDFNQWCTMMDEAHGVYWYTEFIEAA